jgi:hypothetical protein
MVVFGEEMRKIIVFHVFSKKVDLIHKNMKMLTERLHSNPIYNSI